MQLPIGILIYWVKKFDENQASLTGMWYYKELYVPSTVEEKKKCVSDLKDKRCTAISILGTWDQIQDILIQGDLFMDLYIDAENEISMEDLFTDAVKNKFAPFYKLINDIEDTPKDKAYLFDDVNNVKGTALTVDTEIEVDETMEYILEYLRKGKSVAVNISKSWTLAGDIKKRFEGL